MKIFKKILALLCAVALVAGMMSVLSGCGGNSSGNTETTSQPAESTGSAGTSQGNVGYGITLKSAGGLALADVTVEVYGDAGLQDLKGYGRTDENGQVTISLPQGGSYYATLSGQYTVTDSDGVKHEKDRLAGYDTQNSYAVTGTATEIVLTSHVYSGADFTGAYLELGDVMPDFTVTDTNGNTFTLSEALAEKQMVVLNFWYTTCTYCVQEFPYMDTVYQNYNDQVEIIALNNYTSDSDSAIKTFCDNFYDTYDSLEETTGGLSFPMAKDEQGIGNAFNVTAFPTSVVIDRYGVISLIHAGGLLAESYFVNLFEAFTGDDYTQALYQSFDDLNPVITPNVEMPSSEEMAAALNSSDLEITYAPETGTADAEMSWPFIIGQKDGVTCAYASNAGIESSYATLYAYMTLQEGDVVAFDYYASSESGADVMYVLVNRDDVYQISGQSTGWKTCYTWVAQEAGECEVVFCYLKDSSDNEGDDTVYISNVRVVSQSDIDSATYIPRECATHMSADGFGYENYVDVVLSQKDGYYHVGSENGPLLLANMMMGTQFSNDPVYTLVYNYAENNQGQFLVDGVDYYDAIINYCSYASNSQIYSLTPVTEELRQLLQMIVGIFGIEQSENEWLQLCSYYDAYGTGGVQLADPTAGLNAQSAYPVGVGSHSVYYDRIIMPRGLLNKFTPEKSGVYRITSYGDSYVNGWIFTEESLDLREPFYEYWFNERAWTDEKNLSMVVYLEAGVDYYIDIAYYDVYEVGTINFDIEYESAEMDLLVLASPGFFTYYSDSDTGIVAGGINVALGDDGYYHELREDGSLGSILYLDMVSYSNIFNEQCILDLIERGAFDFSLTEDDQQIVEYYEYYEALDFNGSDFETCMKEVWGEDFDYYWDYYDVDDVLDGYYHGEGKDMTDFMRVYANKMYSSGELKNLVAVDEDLAEVLQMLMDKFTFSNVEHSWIKLCYYYQYLGPDA